MKQKPIFRRALLESPDTTGGDMLSSSDAAKVKHYTRELLAATTRMENSWSREQLQDASRSAEHYTDLINQILYRLP